MDGKKVFVISDPHFGHKNVIEFERTEFKTIKDHDEFLIKKWNETVKPNDTIYCLGDVIFGLTEADAKYTISRLNGHKYLIKGNHDKNTNSYYYRLGFEQVYSGPVYVNNGTVILSHEPVKEALNNPYVINIYGHLHNSVLILPNYFSVSAKLVNYTPQVIDAIVYKLGIELKSRNEKFTEEWYFKYTEFKSGEWAGKTTKEVKKEFRAQKHQKKLEYEKRKEQGFEDGTDNASGFVDNR